MIAKYKPYLIGAFFMLLFLIYSFYLVKIGFIVGNGYSKMDFIKIEVHKTLSRI